MYAQPHLLYTHVKLSQTPQHIIARDSTVINYASELKFILNYSLINGIVDFITGISIIPLNYITDCVGNGK